jgi:hypothetical protein
MKELVNQWVARRARLRGVLACGVRFPDKTSITQSWSPDLPAAALDNAWRCASDAFQVLKINSFPNERVRWVYENALLYCARRDDGVCLGIFTSKDPSAFDPDSIERLIAEFRALAGDLPQ